MVLAELGRIEDEEAFWLQSSGTSKWQTPTRRGSRAYPRPYVGCGWVTLSYFETSPKRSQRSKKLPFAIRSNIPVEPKTLV